MVLAIYFALAIVMTWPLVATLGERIPTGSGSDVWAGLWAHWWVKKSLLEGISPFFTNLLYFPEGVSLATYNIPWVNIALWIPFQAIIGNYAAYSLLFIVIFAFNCFAMYLLVMDWHDSIPAAFIAGLIYGFFPNVLSRSGHVNWIFISWLPLALLFLKRTVRHGRVLDAIVTGIFIALIGLTLWHQLIFGFIVFVIYILYLFVVDRSSFSRRIMVLLFLSGVIAVLLMIPLAWPVLQELFTTGNRQDYLASVARVGSTNLMAYIVPNSNLTLWSKIAPFLPGQLLTSTNRIEFVGFGVLALATIGAVSNPKKAWPWLLIILILVLFALGPVLQIGSVQLDQIPMPYRFFQDFFLIRMLRNAQRFNILLSLPLSLLAALGILRLQRYHFPARQPIVFTLILSILVLAEYGQIPYPTADTATPTWYEQLISEQDQFAILGLPMQPGGADKNFMHYQMTHSKALVGGHVSRLSPDAYKFIEKSEILSSLQRDNSFGASNVNVSHQLNHLSISGIKYIVLHKQYETDDKIEEWRDWLTVDPYYEDDELVVYRTNPIIGLDFEILQPLTEEIGLIGASYWPEQVDQTGIMRLVLRWGTKQEPVDDYKACIEFLNADGEVAQTDCNAIPEEWPTTEWRESEVVRTEHHLRLDPSLEPGTYWLELKLMNKDEVVGESQTLGEIEFGGTSRIYETEVDPTPIGANWTDIISLIEFDTDQSGGFIQLALKWQAVNNIDKSYKYFVHLTDLVSGQVVAQVDGIPRSWTYPTNLWVEGEIVDDSIELPLYELDSGIYRLQIGFYDEESGERLSARSASGQPYADDNVILIDFELR